MHVTKKHALIYHAWYNYPQISSQDYEVLAAQMQLFFCASERILARAPCEQSEPSSSKLAKLRFC